MKLTKRILKEIIREEIQNLNEGLPWEHGLDEGWFGDLKAKAQQAYIKANPTSKYAKGVESGEKEAPMTGKEKTTSDKAAAEKKEKDDAQRAEWRKELEKEMAERETSYVTQEFGDDQDQAHAFFSDDIEISRRAVKDVTDKLKKETGFELYPVKLSRAVETGAIDDGDRLSEPLGNLLQNPNKKTLKAFNDALLANKAKGSRTGQGIESWGFGVSAKTAKKNAEKNAEKKAAAADDSGSSSKKSDKSDFAKSFAKAAGGRMI